MKTLEIEVPDDLDLASGSSREELTATARLLFALHLFKQGKITSAQAAATTGLSWRQFLAEAAAQGIPAVSWDDEEIAAERSVVAEGR
jgi:predicted HTH domain antitoxin